VSARAATFGVFFVNGAAIGVWVAQIPFVQDRFDLAKSTLGLILLTMSIGVIVALPIMGQAIVRLGSARAVRLAGIACCVVMPLPILVPEPWLIPFGLLAFGAAGTAPMKVFFYFATIGILSLLVMYALANLAAARHLGGLAAVPCLLGFAIALYTLYRNVWPQPPSPFDVFPYVVAAWLLAGVGLSLRRT